jgi:hypothetical protein
MKNVRELPLSKVKLIKRKNLYFVNADEDITKSGFTAFVNSSKCGVWSMRPERSHAAVGKRVFRFFSFFLFSFFSFF